MLKEYLRMFQNTIYIDRATFQSMACNLLIFLAPVVAPVVAPVRRVVCNPLILLAPVCAGFAPLSPPIPPSDWRTPLHGVASLFRVLK